MYLLPGKVVQAYNPRTLEAEAEGSPKIKGRTDLHYKFQDRQDYRKDKTLLGRVGRETEHIWLRNAIALHMTYS